MAAAVIGSGGEGGANEAPGNRRGNEATYKELWLAARAELDDLRTQFAALLAKLDADSGDTGGDSDYAASIVLADPAFTA